MRLYIDDDSISTLLLSLLRRTAHDVAVPADFGMAGTADPIHLLHAIRNGRTVLTHNHDDFEDLHLLILEAQGHHPGIFAVRKDNDPHRDMKPTLIVRAIRNVETAGVPIADQFIILNHWR